MIKLGLALLQESPQTKLILLLLDLTVLNERRNMQFGPLM